LVFDNGQGLRFESYEDEEENADVTSMSRAIRKPRNYVTKVINLDNQDLAQDGFLQRVGLYTPFHLTPGGGERYFLASAAVFQRMGYQIDIVVNTMNVCQTLQCVKETADTLRINLDYSSIRLVIIQKPTTGQQNIGIKYYYFYSIGHGRAPPVKGCGTLGNFYMNQFPFDIIMRVSNKKSQAIASYDVVLVNSVYTSYYYSQAIMPFIENRNDTQYWMNPSVAVLYPPVTPIDVYPGVTRGGDGVFHIAVLGRFFRGVQAKGHDIAIDLLGELIQRTTQRVHLYLIGNIHPSEDSRNYVTRLQNRSARLELPVTFLTSTTYANISEALSKSTILWHLTGALEPKVGGDPASLEHFGIAVVEAMSVGCIPVVMNRGGTVDIVEDWVSGVLSDDASDYVNHTLRIMGMSASERSAMSKAAMERSKTFHEDLFDASLKKIAVRTKLSQPFKEMAQRALNNLQKKRISIANRSKYAAVIVEPLVSSTFEFAVRNVLHFLGPTWKLVVYYSEMNEAFVRQVLRDVSNVHFKLLPVRVSQVHSYNNLLKNASFWESLEAEKALVFQSDSMMLRRGIDAFLKYDYIGAPWDARTNDRVKSAMKRGELGGAVGNGGFSLRSTRAMVEIIRKYGATSPYDEQEDMFFAKYIYSEGYTYPDVATAYAFCREVPLAALDAKKDRVSHLSLHAAWYYMSQEKFLKLAQ
jgi:glycosyltransferase involved in cell wall biosynthesis